MKLENKSGIYCIENMINNKKYIGQSVNIKDRWRRHFSELSHNCHHNNYLQNSWNKYGEDNFTFYVLEYCPIEDLDKKEIYYINFYNSLNRDDGFNLKSGGQNGGSILSDEVKEKIKVAVTNSYKNSNLKEFRRESALKQWENPELKKKISGSNNGMYGKHHTDEAKKKISVKNKGSKSNRKYTIPVMCIELNKLFIDHIAAGKELCLDNSTILKVCKGERKTCGGYHFEFVKNDENYKEII